MLYLINESLNVNNQKYLYESVQSIIDYYSVLPTSKSFTEDNYRLTRNILRVGITDTFTMFDAIKMNTVIHKLGDYERVYNILSYEILSGYIEYTVEVDLWHTYAYVAQLRNLRVIRSTRDIRQSNISKGFYPSPKQPTVAPNYIPIHIVSNDGITPLSYSDDRLFLVDHLLLVAAIKYNTFEDQSGAVSKIALYGFQIDYLTGLLNITEGLLPIQTFLQEIVSGIYQTKSWVNDAPSTITKAEVVNAWIIDKELVNIEPTTYGDHKRTFTTRTRFTGLYDKDLTPVVVISGANQPRILKYGAKPNTKQYVGTKYNNIEVAPLYNYNEDTEVQIRCIVGCETLQIFAIQGDTQSEITSAFSMSFTLVDGDIRLQRQIVDQLQNTLPIIAGAGTVATGVVTQNPIAVGGGILSMVNAYTRAESAKLQQHMGNLVKSGNAVTSFCDANTRCGMISPTMLNPYYLIEIEDDKTALKELQTYGLVYDVTVDTMAELWTYTDVNINSYSVGTIDGYDYLQCSDVTFNGNIPKEAQQYIYNKLLEGIRIKELTY